MSVFEQLKASVGPVGVELINRVENSADVPEKLHLTYMGLLWAFRQLALEREKNFALQAAVVEKFGWAVASSASAEAKIAPIEKHTGPRSDECVIAFGSMVHRLGMPVPEFTRILTDFGPDVFFVKDQKQAMYQKGLVGASSDVESTAELLSQITSGYENTPKTVGVSAGAFAAILFGALLGSSTVVAFGPATFITQELLTKLGAQDTRSNEVLDGQMLDLRAVLQKHPVPNVHIFYGEKSQFDLEHVEYLRGLDGVKLRPCPTDSHNVAGWLREQGKLAGVLREALSQ